MKRVLILFFLSLASVGLFAPVQAAKPRVKKAVVKTNKVAVTTGYSSARLSRGTNSVVVTFLNLSKVSRINYTLSYNANGVEQGVVGSLTPSGQASDSRDLYFGTCSHGVCTAHRSITGATLTIETKLKSGGTHVKRYRIKI
jgi:hypothetical protein